MSDQASPAGVASTPEPPTPAEWARALGLFVLTLFSVWWSYGFWWRGAAPWTDSAIALDAARFAAGMMTIFAAHEAGHYIVARRHGMEQSLPHFIPFPLAFGTLGAIIRLRTLPPSRAALLEMGAAGPLSGFAVAIGVMWLGLPATVDHAVPELVAAWPPPELVAEPSALDPVWNALDGLLSAEPLASLLPTVEPNSMSLMVMANPGLMDVVGWARLGAAPGRYCELSALGFAGWAGCFLTAMNLLPIGQLDGGHVANALFPRHARRIGQVAMGFAAIGGLLWGGWVIWALLLWKMGAHRGLPVDPDGPLTTRAKLVAAAIAVAFAACFMPQPFKMESWNIMDMTVLTPEGVEITAEQKRAYLDEQRPVAAPQEGHP